MKWMLAVLFAFAVQTAFAVDGQVLINQASVTAAGGFPFKITQPGSYKLSGNLVGPTNTTVILIQASNVVLDLNGFNIKCSYTPPTGFALAACVSDNFAHYSGITVRNGSITSVGNAPVYNPGQNVTGLYLNSVGCLIELLHFSAADSTGYATNGLNSGAFSIIRNNTFSDGASPGVGCPSVVENNANQTGGAGSNGTGCKYVNNVGLFAL